MSTRETYLALLAEGANSYWTVRAGPHLFPIQEEGGVWVCYRTHLEAVTAAVEVHHVDPHLVELVGIIRPDPSAVTPETSWKTEPSEPDPYFVPKPLEASLKTAARYSQATRAEVQDAISEMEHVAAVGTEELDASEFLAFLWTRGLKVVPNGDGAWKGDDNGDPHA